MMIIITKNRKIKWNYKRLLNHLFVMFGFTVLLLVSFIASHIELMDLT